MINLVLPLGGSHGWGVCGKYISRELASLGEKVRLFTDPFSADQLGDDLAFHALRSLVPSPDEIENARATPKLDGPVFCAIAGNMFVSIDPILYGTPTAGYTFFEDNLLADSAIDNAKQNFDIVFTGSSWCTDILKERGVASARTLLQGVDPVIFHPLPQVDRRAFGDRFVIFTGGKFEFRKGQDIVIRAYKALQDRHADVMLVTSWYNIWPASLATMRMSSLITFAPTTIDYLPMMNQILSSNGIDVNRVITLPPRPNAMMAPVYHAADVGLFPNRCEGGTNLVMMEFMACGKPVVASFNSGHKDIITDENAILIKQSKTITVNRGGQPIANWDDPDLDETIERLEFAYQNRDKLKEIGARAGNDMKNWTWERTARQLKDDIEKHATK